MTDKKIDLDRFEEIATTANDLKDIHAARDTLLDDMTDAYTLDWEDESDFKARFDNIVATKSPDGRDAVMGGVRLLCANDYGISVPREKMGEITEETADKIEKDAAAMLRASDRIQGCRLLRDAAKSALLWDEIHISVTSTKDMVEHLQGMGDSIGKAALVRAKAAQAITPYLFKVLDPRSGYPDFDDLGLRAYLREAEMYPREIVDKYGPAGEDALNIVRGKTTRHRNEKVTVRSFWDLDMFACWIKDSNTPIFMEEYGLSFIPIVCKIVEGSLMFEDMDEQREPFLYTFVESGMWNRLNLALTAIYTSVSAVGLFPTLVYRGAVTSQTPKIDTTLPWGMIRIAPDEELGPMMSKGIIDPALMQALDIAERKGMESTIYRQTLGQPLGANATFSETALLHQAGRLPLISAKEKVGWAIGDALRLAYLWIREEGGKHKLKYKNYSTVIDPKEIPNDLEVEVDIDVALPENNLQMANIFNILNGKVSQEWLLEKIMKVRQPKQMIEDTMTEQAVNQLYMAWVQKKIQEMMQPPMPPPDMAGGMPPGAMPPPEVMPAPGMPPPPGNQPPNIPPQMMRGFEQPIPPQPPMIPPMEPVGEEGQGLA